MLKQKPIAQILFFISFLLISLIILFVQNPTRLVMIDLKSIVMLQAKREPLTNDKAKQKFLRNFSKTLEITLDNYSKKHHVIIMPKQAIISGDVFDITDTINEALYASEG